MSTDTLELALAPSGCDAARVVHRPRLLSQWYVLRRRRSRPLARGQGHGPHPWRDEPSSDPGRIQRWHQTLKNWVLPEIYFLPGHLVAAVSAFVDHYNQRRNHESPRQPDARRCLLGRAGAIMEAREKIKKLSEDAT